jgi:hypothetical protein
MLVVPVLMFERLGIVDSVKRSASLLNERWGEGISGIGSIGGAMVLIMLPLMVIPVVIMPISLVAGLIGLFAMFVAVMGDGRCAWRRFHSGAIRIRSDRAGAWPLSGG